MHITKYSIRTRVLFASCFVLMQKKAELRFFGFSYDAQLFFP